MQRKHLIQFTFKDLSPFAVKIITIEADLMLSLKSNEIPSSNLDWAEFYVNGTWAIADPQKNTFMKNQSDYLSMRFIEKSSMDNPGNNGGLSGCSGEGIKVKMKS